MVAKPQVPRPPVESLKSSNRSASDRKVVVRDLTILPVYQPHLRSKKHRQRLDEPQPKSSEKPMISARPGAWQGQARFWRNQSLTGQLFPLHLVSLPGHGEGERKDGDNATAPAERLILPKPVGCAILQAPQVAPYGSHFRDLNGILNR